MPAGTSADPTASTSTWRILYWQSTSNHYSGTPVEFTFGIPGDIPLTWKMGLLNPATMLPLHGVAIWRPATGKLRRINPNPTPAIESTPITYGTAGDIPLMADTDGTGGDEFIVFRPETRQFMNYHRGLSFVMGTASDVGSYALGR